MCAIGSPFNTSDRQSVSLPTRSQFNLERTHSTLRACFTSLYVIAHTVTQTDLKKRWDTSPFGDSELLCEAQTHNRSERGFAFEFCIKPSHLAKKWETMNNRTLGWVEILEQNDAEAVWTKLFKLVSRHSSIRSLIDTRSVTHQPQDLFVDITQDLFLKLHRKQRWQHYLDAGYRNEEIDHELYHIEIPNLVSLMFRERHPEAYRLARRISNLIQTSPEFRRFPGPLAQTSPNRKGKMALRVYGLREWSQDKTIRPYQEMHQQIADVSV